jgi:hypothetical protein
MKTNWVIRILFIVALVMSVNLIASAQTTTATNTTAITASKAESLTISASSLSQYDLAALAPQTLTINTTWNLKPQKTSVAVCTYMTVAGRMKGSDPSNTDVIDETMVQTKPNGAGSFANINAGTACGTAATLVKSYTLSTQATRKNVTNADTVQIQLNGVPGTIQADVYSGTITVQALAQ